MHRPAPLPPATKPCDEPGRPDGGAPRQVPSAALFQGGREVVIVHGDAVYRLQITRQGKLILTK